MQKFTAAKIKCIGGKVGNFYGLDENELKAILDNVMSRISHLSEQTRNGIEDLLTEKMQAILLEVNLAGRHTAENLRTQIKQNYEGLEEKLSAFIADVVAANTADMKEYIAAQTRLASSEAAKAVLRLNDIETALDVIQSGQMQNSAVLKATLEAGKMTYAQILSLGGTLEMIREEVRLGNDRLQQEMRDTHKDVGRIELLLTECLRKVEQRIIPIVEKSETADYDRLMYEREVAKSTVREQVGLLSQRIMSAGNADELKQALVAYQSNLDVQIRAFHKEHDEIRKSIDSLRMVLSPKWKHGEDCARCGSVSSRIYKCDVCGFMGKNEDLKKERDAWDGLTDWYDVYEDILLIGGAQFNDGNVNLGRFQMALPSTIRTTVRRIVFREDVRRVMCRIDGDYRCIRELFPNVRSVSFIRPAGNVEEYCILGQNLFKGCGATDHSAALKLYGMEFVRDIESHCFAGWGITDENHNDFLTQHGFTDRLHQTLTAKGIHRKREWRM